MTLAEVLNRPPSFLRRALEPAPEQPTSKPADALLDQIAADLADALPDPGNQPTFTDRLRDFGDGADRLMTQHRANTDRLRLALAENAVLRARNGDLEKHAADLTAYWERQYEAVNARAQRISRQYYALIGRFDMAVEMMNETRAAARREAFAQDDTDEPRPDGVEVRERNPEPAADDPVVTRLRVPQDLPPNRL